MKAQTLAKAIADLALTKKATDVVMMDLRGLTSMADYFVVCSADSDVQVRAIADAVEDGMEQQGAQAWHREAGSRNWILLDYVDVVLHVFHKNTRPFYNLEKLWGDAAMHAVNEKKSTPEPKKKAAAKAKAKTPAKRRTAKPAAKKPASSRRKLAS